MKSTPTTRTKSLLPFFLIVSLLSAGCGDSAKKGVNKEEMPMTTEATPAKKVHVAFAGGGWRAHTGHSAFIISLLDGKNDLKWAFANVETIASNSGGSWFNTMLAMSPDFVQDIEAKNAITTWGTNGQGWLGTQQNLFQNAPKSCNHVSGWSLFALCALDYDVGSIWNWPDIAQKAVYKGYSLGKSTLTENRQPWATDKNLLLAGSMLKTNVVMNGDGPGKFYDHTQFYMACVSPNTPKLGFLPNSAASCSGNASYTEVIPVVFSGLANDSLTTPPFLPSLGAKGSLNLLYSETSIDPDTAKTTLANPVSNQNLPALYAATASSAAIGFEAYVRKGQITDPWEAAYKARDLAPSFSLANDEVQFKASADNLSAKQLANQKMVRIADGGTVDNSGVAQLVSFLQLNNEADKFDIIAFDHVTSAFPPPKSSFATKAKVGGDIANLFGQGLCDGNQFCVRKCDDTINPCIYVPGLQIFEVAALQNTPASWSIKSGNMHLIYTKYEVTTVDNSAFAVSKGSSGTLHAFTCVAPDAGTVPSDRSLKGYYDMLKFIHTSLKANKGEGLNSLKKAFGLQ